MFYLIWCGCGVLSLVILVVCLLLDEKYGDPFGVTGQFDKERVMTNAHVIVSVLTVVGMILSGPPMLFLMMIMLIVSIFNALISEKSFVRFKQWLRNPAFKEKENER